MDWSIIAPAIAAGLLVLATHVPLGQQVLARGIIFIDLAIAQIAALGVVAAHAMHWEAHGWQVQLAAASAALAGAALLYYTDRRWPRTQEAFIGSVFVLAASAAIIMLAANPRSGEHIKDLLAGQILWVQLEQLYGVAVLYALIAGLWWFLRHRSRALLFYLAFALAVTASVQLIGIYLVFATLIVPALATHRLRGRMRWIAGYGVGIVGYVAGIVLSAKFDVPTGALVVWMLAATAAIFRLAAPRKWFGESR